MTRLLTAAFIGIILSSCSTDDPQPVTQNPPPGAPKLIPEVFKEADFSKQFVYNTSGQLAQIKMSSQLSNGGTMDSWQNFEYDLNGKLTQSTTDTGWRMEYTFSGDYIVRTDEFVNGTHSQFHIYSYDAKGRLAEKVTYQDIPEEGGIIPVSKDTYQYDERGNLTAQQLYYYTSFGAEAKLLTTMTFSNYDDKINSEDYFDASPFNPLVMFRKNNPGKLEVRNGQGVLSMSEVYTYEYHAKGYATTKTTVVTMYNGTTNSYQSTYRFKE